MERKWMYVLIVIAMAAFVVVIGSVAQKTDVASAGPDPAGAEGHTSGLIYSNTIYPNVEWNGYLNTAGYVPIYTVPASHILYIDDVQYQNMAAAQAYVLLYRGPPGYYYWLTYNTLPSYGNFARSYKNLYLNQGEQLKVYSGNAVPVYFTITGHLEMRP